MSELRITFCNRAYAEKWYKNLRKQNAAHFAILQSIMDEIQLEDGGDIRKSSIFQRHPNIEQMVHSLKIELIPSRGQMLRHNGNGIRHVKFAPSKNIAIIWEKIREDIYITFDDHAPIRYHRAIRHLRDIRLGIPALPKKARSSGQFLRKLKIHWKLKYSKGLKGIDLKRQYYE